MARKAIAARGGGGVETLGGFAGRVGWVVLAGLWIFAATSVATFDEADWPSHAVAVHNQPTRNLCGPAGAVLGYWCHHVLGPGVWVVLAGIAGALGAALRRHPAGHPAVRLVGLLLAAWAVSGFFALLGGGSGALPGSEAGLVADFAVQELTERFSVVGTALVLLAALSVGAVVCADRALAATAGALLRAGPRARPLLRALRAVRAIRLPRFGWGRAEPQPGGSPVTRPPDSREREAPAESTRKRRLDPAQLREKLAKLPVRMSSARVDVARDEDIPRPESFAGYEFPTIDLLEDPEVNYSSRMETFVRKQAQQLEESLRTYGLEGEVVGIESGPVVTLYSVELAPGTKVARLQSVSSDVARALRAPNVRIVANMAGKTTVGIEVPNFYKERVRLKELMSSGHAEGMALPMFLGKDASGEPLVADLAIMPHMLIAGTTGSGKSVCINTIIMSWMYTKRPDELKLILVDPKMVEMSQFQDIPHLMCPVVTETAKATAILEWAVQKMEERYELLREAGVRNVASYNVLEERELFERLQPQSDAERARIPRKLPYIVFIIDELADLIMTHSEVENSIVRIAQKARAVGMHLMVATQRPQANVVTGLIKSNMPCRASFKVASGMDSRIVLDQKGAELLLGQGDMLFLTPHSSELRRAQGTLVTDAEIRRVVKCLRQAAAPSFEPALLTLRPAGDEGEVRLSERDPLFDEAVRIMIESGRGSVSLLQRRLGIGYTRASRLVDQMALAGILGDHKGSVAREVIISLEDWEQMRAMEEAAEASATLFDEQEEEEEKGEAVAGVDGDDDEGDEESEYDGEYEEDETDDEEGEDETDDEDGDEEDDCEDPECQADEEGDEGEPRDAGDDDDGPVVQTIPRKPPARPRR
jgi:S-DNA-T family DNA segregation ATPase FtsK/SpoIIIE